MVEGDVQIVNHAVHKRSSLVHRLGYWRGSDVCTTFGVHAIETSKWPSVDATFPTEDFKFGTDILQFFAASFSGIWKAFTRSPASGKVSSHDWQTLAFTVTRGEGGHSGPGEGMSQELREAPFDFFAETFVAL